MLEAVAGPRRARRVAGQGFVGHQEDDMSVEPRTLTGSCMCGRVAYEVADTFEYAMNCHCSQCRRSTGSAFKPLAGTKTARLSLTKGDGELLRYGDEHGHDAHCRSCGSLLYSLVRERQYVHVAMGT